MKSIKILLVENDLAHALLIEKNLRRSGITNEILHFDNGQSGIDYLEGQSCPQGRYEGLVVILELDVPILSGYQVLTRIKSDEKMKKIPVVILTTIDIPEEISKCYELGCNIFITKPVQYDEFCTTVHNLGLQLSNMKFPK